VFPNVGVWLVALVGFGMILGLLLFDAWFIRRNAQPVGRWVEAWSRRFPVLAFLLAAVLGLLIGHFYWSTPPVCPPSAVAGTDRDCVPAQQRT
jgi:Zn-dependent protease